MINININDISNKVRTTLLTGLNTALTGAILATDTVLEAFGKLQNQLNGKVPYTGATSDVNLGEFGVQLGNIEFDTTPTNTPTAQGSLFWDVDSQTLDLVMNGVTQKIGQEEFYYVKNQTGSPIAKGTVVRANGTLGNSGRILIAPFLADGTYPSDYVLGIVAENIANGADGFVTSFGKIRGVNTNAYLDGDILYASTTVAGGLTKVKPSAPNNIVTVAIVIKADNNGILFVRPTYGSNINNDEGVLISSPLNNNILRYNSTSGLWQNDTIVSALGYTPENVANKENTLLDTSTTKYPTNNLVKTYVDTGLTGKENTITTLPISKGGTNSGTALNNNRVMQSSGGAIVEAPAITANRALVSDVNGIPVASSVTDTTLGYLDATSSVQTQLNRREIVLASTSTLVSVATTGEVIVYSKLIPANTVVAGSNLILNVTGENITGTNNTKRFRPYFNTSVAIPSGQQLINAIIPATSLYWKFHRTFGIPTNGTIKGFLFGSTAANYTDVTASTGAINTNSVDWTVDQYFILTLVNGASDENALSYLSLTMTLP